MAYQPFTTQALRRGAGTADYDAVWEMAKDTMDEAKIETEMYEERQDELGSSLTSGGLLGSLLSAALIAGKAAATGGFSAIADVPAWLWATGAGVGGGLGAMKEAWTGASAEGIGPGLFGVSAGNIAESDYFDNLRKGIVSTGVSSGLGAYTLASLGGLDYTSLLDYLRGGKNPISIGETFINV